MWHHYGLIFCIWKHKINLLASQITHFVHWPSVMCEVSDTSSGYTKRLEVMQMHEGHKQIFM